MKRLIFTIIALLLTASVAFAVTGTIVLDDNVRFNTDSPGAIREIKWTYTCAGGLAVSASVKGVTGQIVGTDANPISMTDNYDVTITNAQGLDVLQGGGANLDDTVTDQDNVRYPISAYTGAPITLSNDTLIFNVANGTTTDNGVFTLLVKLP